MPRFSVRVEGDVVSLDLDELKAGGATAVCRLPDAPGAAHAEAGTAVSIKPAQAAV